MNQILPRSSKSRLGPIKPSYQQPSHAVAMMPEVVSLPEPAPSLVLSMFQAMVNKLAMLDNLIAQARVSGSAVLPATGQMVSLAYLQAARPVLVQNLEIMRAKVNKFYTIPAAVSPFGYFGTTTRGRTAAQTAAAVAAQIAAAEKAKAAKAAKAAKDAAAKKAKLDKQIAAEKAKYEKLLAQAGMPIPTPAGAVVTPPVALPPSAIVTTAIGGGGGADSGINYGQDYDKLPPLMDDYNPFPLQGGPPETSTLFDNPFAYEETQGEVVNWGNPFVPRDDARQLHDAVTAPYSPDAPYDYIEDPKDWMSSISPFGADPNTVRRVKIGPSVQAFSGIEGIIGSLISAGGAIGAAALAPKTKVVTQPAVVQSQQTNFMPMALVGLGAVALLIVLMRKK